MNREQLTELLHQIQHLKNSHRLEFEHWYDQANMLDVRDYTFTGWIIDRKLAS